MASACQFSASSSSTMPIRSSRPWRTMPSTPDAGHLQHERRFLYQVLGLTDCLDRKATRECVLDDVHDARGRPALYSDGSDVRDEIGNRRLLVHSDEEAQREAIASSDSDDVVGAAVP